MTSSTNPLRSLSPSRCWELLATHEVGRLAAAVGGHPDVFLVNYSVLGTTLVIRTEEGSVLQAATGSPSVAFEVDVLDRASRTAWSIVAKGSVAEPEHVEDYLQAQDAGVEPWPAGDKDRYLIITPDTVRGRILAPAVSPVVLTNND